MLPRQQSAFRVDVLVNLMALRKAKIVCNFGLSECNRVKALHVISKALPDELSCKWSGFVVMVLWPDTLSLCFLLFQSSPVFSLSR